MSLEFTAAGAVRRQSRSHVCGGNRRGGDTHVRLVNRARAPCLDTLARREDDVSDADAASVALCHLPRHCFGSARGSHSGAAKQVTRVK